MGQTFKTGGKRTKRGSVKQDMTKEEKTYNIKQEATHSNPKP